MNSVSIKSALISVYYKDNLEPIIRKLNELGIKMISTGGTYDFITAFGIVLVLGHFSVWAGAFALSLIMFPIVASDISDFSIF